MLVPLEHAGPEGTTDEVGAVLVEQAGWTPAQRALLDDALRCYWRRGSDLARRTRHWLPPRRRHVAVLADATGVRPWAQLLNTSAWTLYAGDVDPARSHPELIAHCFVLFDRMAHTGEVTSAAFETAAWWFERSDEERAAYATAAAASARPDAEALRATAEATDWLRRLGHEDLRPMDPKARVIRGTGLFVPRELEREPARLAKRWTSVARHALADFHAAWRKTDSTAVAALGAWLADEAPPVVVTARRRVLWDPQRPVRTTDVERALGRADAVAVASIRVDLETIARHTRAFLQACVDPDALHLPADATEAGYASLRADRRLIAYDLEEPGMERLHGPPLPYEQAMLGARAAHEWGHVADASGFVRCALSDADFATVASALARALDAVVAAAPANVRERTAPDLAALGAAPSPGHALARAALSRLPDLRANLVARAFMDDVERETYVRHNVRPLAHPPAALWRLLVRHLVEYQYLGPLLGGLPLAVRRTHLFEATSFGRDFIDSGLLDVERFDALARLVEVLATCWAIDERHLRVPRA